MPVKKTSKKKVVAKPPAASGKKKALAKTKASAPGTLSSAASEGKPTSVMVTKPGKMSRAEAERLSALTKKWENLQRRAKNVKAEPYSMRKAYAPKTAIQHKLLGWGFVLDNKNDRLEVLFRDGIRYLISNYQN